MKAKKDHPSSTSPDILANFEEHHIPQMPIPPPPSAPYGHYPHMEQMTYHPHAHAHAQTQIHPHMQHNY